MSVARFLRFVWELLEETGDSPWNDGELVLRLWPLGALDPRYGVTCFTVLEV